MFYECTQCKRVMRSYSHTDSCCIGCEVAKLELEEMLGTGKAYLYFIGDKVTNWTGKLRFKLTSVKTSRHNMAGKRYDYWFIVNGFYWHGYTVGDFTQIAHCKQTKRHAYK